MARLFITLAACATTSMALVAAGGMRSSTSIAAQTAPAMIGVDQPILLKRMVVTATPLPDTGR